MDGYVGGRIRKIKIRDFMTYDYVNFNPEEGLNLIVGVNGSGKSSIMCAICLGLAGKPQFTGRASQLSDFIKHGCTEAEIEIKLESKRNEDIVICRKIKGDKCEWLLNGSSSSHSEVSSVVKQFNIDTSNLCQFLPQEKVAEFSRMDKKQRLENMLQAIGEPYLFELFNDLKKLHKELSELEHDLKKVRVSRNTAEEENERISDEVKKQENRSRLKDQLVDLKKQKKILIYQQIYNECQALKEEAKNLKGIFETLVQEREEAENQEQSIFKSYWQCSARMKSFNSQKKNLINKLTENSNMLTTFKEQVENEKIEYKNRLKEKQNQLKKIMEQKKMIDGLEIKLINEKTKFQSFIEKDQLNSQALAHLQSEISELNQKIERSSVDKNQVDYSIMELRGQLASLKDEQKQKFEILRRRDSKTYCAAMWLLDNRGRFKSNVYLPIMLEINVKSSAYMKYIENLISFKDVIAFVCEDKSDCERLTDILKNEMKLPVNIVMAPDDRMSKYTRPPLTREYSQCGLECFVKDLFTAPEPVMKYLCACCGIHNVPVTKSAIKSSDIDFILQKYPLFFSDNMRISCKRSRYGEKNLSIKKDFIVSQNLLVNHNDELQKEVERKLQQLAGELEIKKGIVDGHKADLDEKEKIQEKLRLEKKSLYDQKKTLENLQFDILQKRKFFERSSVIIDEEEEKVRINRTIQSINKNREAALSEQNTLFKDFLRLEREVIKTILKLNRLSREFKLAKAANEDLPERVKTAETNLKKVSDMYHEKKHKGRILSVELKQFGDIDKNFLEDPNLHMVNSTLDSIEQEINHIKAELDLNEDNEQLLKEYYGRKKDIDSIEKRIDDLVKSIEDIKQIIETKKEEWLQPLSNHINNINKKFSHYFKQLSCAGEISLDIPENSNDFSKYGLQIRLKFHDDVPLTELSQTHHSGGECSVAAIVFILSLQELTEVPFRCIDEINQGMDSVNERKIYQLIADSVGQDRCSQYFLLTPKLLDGLEYPDDVAVHIIFNSCFINMKLDVKKHIEIAKSA